MQIIPAPSLVAIPSHSDTKTIAPLRGIHNRSPTQPHPTPNSTLPQQLFTQTPFTTITSLDDRPTLQFYILGTLRPRQFHTRRSLLCHRRLFALAYHGRNGCGQHAFLYVLSSTRAGIVATVEVECIVYCHQFVSYCFCYVE